VAFGTDVVTLDRQQHGRARGQAHDMALAALDADEIVGRERLA
jgi:hypothetical protein